MIEPRPEKLFLYGTLRGDGDQNSLLVGCRRLGETTVSGIVYDLGPYPALSGQRKADGEVWECPCETLASLDTYEGVAYGSDSLTRVVL
ncbi:MAG: hypothetical protein GEU90_09940 [Gemmatimonas sp.]|nr:hypothetical protein [Gemmatimonas sp.]